MNSHHLLLQEIEEDPNLPVISSSIASLLKALNNDDVGYTELADELENHPSIAIKILATANSAWASPVTPITTLRNSCARIGVPVVRSISIALSIAQIFDPARCAPFDAKTYWVSALLTAEAAQLYAKNIPDICSDTARMAGLLHNIGLLWLASQKPAETAIALELTINNDNSSLSDNLMAQLNINLYSAGGYLASYMELPEKLVNVIASPTTYSQGEEALFDNHYHAKQLASSVLAMNELDAEEIKVLNEEPQFLALSAKLPEINSLVQTLFF